MKPILNKVFGEFNYKSPAWLLKIFSVLGASRLGVYLAQHFSLRKTEPKKFYKKTGLFAIPIIVLSVGSFYGWKWYEGRPQPRLVTFGIDKPGITSPEESEVDPLTIKFSQSVARLEDLNKVITDRIKLKPEIVGTWSWENDQTLKFKPDLKTKADWLIGTEYSFEFKKSLFADHIRLDKFDGEFKTPELLVSQANQEFYIDPKEPKIKKALFHIYFTHPIQIEDLKSHLQMSIASESGIGVSRKLNYTIQLNKWANEAHISSEALTIDDRPQTLRLNIEKGYKPKTAGQVSKEEKELKVAIPGRLTAFKIASVDMEVIRNQKYEPEQIILVRTSLDAKSEDVAAKIQMKLLPKNKPAGGIDKEVKNYPWSSASEINEEVEKKLTDIKFTVIPSEHAFSKIHSFKVYTTPDTYAWIEVQKGLQSLGDFVLDEPSSSIVQIKPYPEEVSIMSDGSLLSLSGELKVPLMARNARNIEISISRIIPDQVNHLLSQISYDIKKPYYNDDIENKTTEKFTSNIPLNFESAQATQFFSFDLGSYLHKSQSPKGIFLVKATIIHPDKSYGPTDQRLIMVTDLGLLVKETQSRTHEIFVQNLRSGTSVKTAQVEVIGRNGLTVLSSTTDPEGHTVIPDLKDFKNEKEPIAFSVRVGGDQAFLPFRNSKQDLQYSRFDVGGLYENSSSEQINSMLFSDRGIYRPGESIHMGMIIRSKTAKLKNQLLPLEWSVMDPQGNVITKEKVNVNSDDLKSIQFKTEETSPVGTYDVSLHLIKKDDRHEFIGHQTVRVEEFQPDRLKIRTSLSKEKLLGWVKVQDLKAMVSLRNLFGAAAEDRTIKAKVTLTPQQPYFKGFDQYQFTHFDQTQLQIQKDDLKDQKTNTKGEAEFDLKMTAYEAPYFSLRFDAEGFEAEAGKSVRASSSVLLSTLDFMIGAKPDGDLDYIKKGSERHLQVIAIDPDLKKVAAKDLTMEIIERKYLSVLTQSESGNYKYQSVLKLNTIKTNSYAVTAEGSQYKINTDLAGDFYIIVKNKENVELLKLPYTVAGEANLARSLDRNAELQLALNKKDYKIGEEIEMQIKAPYHGAGLISIERDGIYNFKWFKSETSSTVQRIKVPEGLSGNAYVTVTFLRAIDSKEIFMSPLSYAVVPFSISLEDRKTTISLNSPEKVKPGQKLKIEYSTNQPTDLILYGVDEGILQVAQYKLPDPLAFFFQKRALQVKTYQMLDLLMPEFSLIQQSQAAGGDEGAGAIGKNLNPFRSKRAAPVAFWSGVIKSDSKVRTYSYDVPDYFNGNIKVMAVAASSKNLGANQTSSFVRGDFIITPTTPIFVAPLDEFKVGLTVSNQKEKSGDQAQVKLAVKTNKLFEVTANASQNLEIGEGHEVATQVSFKAINNVGEGQITFEASHQNTSAIAKADISVRPSVPYQNLLQVDFTNKSTIDVTEKTAFFEPFSKHTISASYSPLSIGVGLQAYLVAYPYGCTEQVISRTLPSVLLTSYQSGKNKKLVEKQKENIKSITRILRSRQAADGGFSLYEKAGAESHQAASLYAIQFLIELNDKKLIDVIDLLQKARPYLQRLQSAEQGELIENYRKWAEALYLSARLKVVNGASLAALRQELKAHFKDEWMKDPTAFYLAATYKLYKQDDEAEQLFKKFKLGEGLLSGTNDYSQNYFDSLSRDATLIYLAALYAGESYSKIVDVEQLKKLLVEITGYHYQTFSAANLLLAFEAMEQRGRSQPLVAELKALVETKRLNIEAQTTQAPLTWSLPIVAEQVQLTTNAAAPLFYAYQKSGFAMNSEQKPEKKNIEIIRQYKNANNQDVNSVKIGDEVNVILALRTTDEKSHSHIAIVDLLPGGFELIPQKDLNRLDSGDVYGEDADVEQPPAEEDGESGAGAFFSLAIPKAYAQSVKSSLKSLYTDFIDQREDRVVVYATLTPEVTSFEYKMKAVSEGKFRIPSTFAEGMYNRDLRFVGPTGWIEVKSEK
jgi:uncharacterized protein YfaS (alpha-2-macroglobulin family)